jgi:DNA-binding response OmpR family regulator
VKGHVVVIDDERELLEMMRFALEAEGFSVTALEAPDPRQLATTTPPDVFLIDLLLGTTHGQALADWLEANTDGNIPMIGISASSTELHLAQQSGVFCAVLAKPFDLKSLIGCVSECLVRTASASSGGAIDTRGLFPVNRR